MAQADRGLVLAYRRNWGMVGLLAFIFLAWLGYVLPFIFYVPGYRYIGLPLLVILGAINGASILSALRWWRSAPREVELGKKEITVRNQDRRERVVARVTRVKGQWKWYHALVFNQGFVVEGTDANGNRVREGFFTSDLGLAAVRELEAGVREWGGIRWE